MCATGTSRSDTVLIATFAVSEDGERMHPMDTYQVVLDTGWEKRLVERVRKMAEEKWDRIYERRRREERQAMGSVITVFEGDREIGTIQVRDVGRYHLTVYGGKIDLEPVPQSFGSAREVTPAPAHPWPTVP